MQNKLIKVFIIMTLLVLISGVLLHFLYEWSGNNPFVATFAAVNESTWEHLKLAFFPMLVFGIISYFFIKNISTNFIEGLTIGILTSILFIVIFFYGYQAIIGTNIDFLNILDFVLGIIIGEYVFYKVVSMDNYSDFFTKSLCIIILCLLYLFFITFTFSTPIYEIFKDPISGSYGFMKKIYN